MLRRTVWRRRFATMVSFAATFHLRLNLLPCYVMFGPVHPALPRCRSKPRQTVSKDHPAVTHLTQSFPSPCLASRPRSTPSTHSFPKPHHHQVVLKPDGPLYLLPCCPALISCRKQRTLPVHSNPHLTIPPRLAPLVCPNNTLGPTAMLRCSDPLYLRDKKRVRVDDKYK